MIKPNLLLGAVMTFSCAPGLLYSQTGGEEAIDAGVTMITFALSGEAGASEKFVKRYRKLIKALEQSDQDKAVKQFSNMQKSPRNLYEEAYYQILKFQYLEKFDGSQNAKYAALGQRDASPDRKNRMARILEQIENLCLSDATFKVRGQFGKATQSTHALLKNTFSFSSIEGDIAELRLHCDKGRGGFAYKPDTGYAINEKWSDCTLIMIETPGTKHTIEEGA
ncbi:MAG: hypothetical protein ACI9UU_001363 [Candidatus Azotimanducaceae bacterium]|jgi:hypothetical protein